MTLLVIMCTIDKLRLRGYSNKISIFTAIIFAGAFSFGAMYLYDHVHVANPIYENITHYSPALLDSAVVEANEPDRFKVKRFNNLKLGGSITNFESFEVIDTYTNTHYILIRHDNNISICKQ